MKQAFASAFFLMLALTLSAQSIKPIVVEIPDKGLYFSNQRFNVVAVLDERSHRETIGNAHKGMANKPVALVFPKAADVYLLDYFQRNLPTYTDLLNVKVKVDRMSLSERPMSMKELAYAELAIEVLTEKEGEWYSLGKYEASVEESGADVTPRHGERLYQLFLNCMTQFATSDMQLMAYTPAAPKPIVLDYGPYMRSGLYKNYAEWSNLEKKPEINLKYEIRTSGEDKKIPRYLVFDAKTKKRVKGLYAFTDGADFYLNASHYTNADYFIKTKLIGPYFLFEDIVTDPNMGVAFGLVGSAASIRHNLYLFNPASGNIRVLDDKFMKELLSPYPELMKKWEGTKGKLEDKREMIAQLNGLLQEPQ